jgi:Tfp pilus assembly protein FimT
MLELLIILAIFATLAGIAAPRFSSAAKVARVQAAGQKLAEELRGARDAAWRRATAVEVRFTLGSGVFEWVAADGSTPDGSNTIDLGAAPYGARVTSVSGGATLAFDGYGNPDRSASVVVRGADLIVTVSVATDGSVTVSSPSRLGMGV